MKGMSVDHAVLREFGRVDTQLPGCMTLMQGAEGVRCHAQQRSQMRVQQQQQSLLRGTSAASLLSALHHLQDSVSVRAPHAALSRYLVSVMDNNAESSATVCIV